MKFRELQKFYNDHQRTMNKPKSAHCARLFLARLSLTFGNREVSQISSRDVQAYIEKRRQEVSASSVNAELRILRAFLNWAKEEGFIEEVPVKVKLLRVPKKRVLHLLSKPDIQKILEHAEGQSHGLILVASASGMRSNELAHLSWSDVRVDEGVLTVTCKKDVNWTPKSHSERSIPVPSSVLEYLQKLRKESRFQGDNDYVFPTRKGTPHSVFRICQIVREAFQSAGYYVAGEPLIHKLRHSYCTNLLHSAVDVSTVQDLMGHADCGTTLKYAHSNHASKTASLKFSLV